ncbi:hypothetical protein [Rubidibacter lacunae]|uniref:hypothetical protein n=1 Tax=Rubidibacter lacunae TaxID=582514 RepID=UPI0005908DF8|nr:hypothetical protein [Rubidibacter lacunae]
MLPNFSPSELSWSPALKGLPFDNVRRRLEAEPNGLKRGRSRIAVVLMTLAREPLTFLSEMMYLQNLSGPIDTPSPQSRTMMQSRPYRSNGTC